MNYIAKFPENYRVYVATHRGLVRENNEDNFTVNTVCKRQEYNNVSYNSLYDAPLLAAVFDGMGGESMGEDASYLSAKLAKGLYSEVKRHHEAPPAELAGGYVQRANDAIRRLLEENKCGTGGCTVAAAIIKNEIIYPFSLGDSRIYLLRNNKLSQLSVDHTLAMKKVAAKIYTREVAEKSPDSHKLTAFLGADYYHQGLAPQYYEPVVMQKSDKVLLCSDGLYDELPKLQIQNIIKNHPDNPAMELIKAAVRHGGHDNVTCVLVEREL